MDIELIGSYGEQATVIEVVNAAAGEFREVKPPRVDAQDITEVFQQRLGRTGRRMRLSEAAELMEDLSTTEFPQLLRRGLRPILFSEYAGWPSTHQVWCAEEPSDAEYETGIEMSNLGKAPIVAEGQDYPEATAKLDRSIQIQNQKRGYALPIHWEMLRYDRTGMIRDLVAELGGSMRYTEEDDAYTVLTTGGNYTRNSTTADNDIGANTASTQFGPVGLMTAYKTLTTMKDRKSGRYLGVMPDTLVVGVGLTHFAKQLLTSPTIMPLGDPGSAATLYGQGTTNPFRDMIKTIVVSPLMGGQYRWVLGQAKKFIKKFVVQDLELLDGSVSDWSYKKKKSLYYRIDKVYGIGMWNDRFAFYSSDATGPLVG